MYTATGGPVVLLTDVINKTRTILTAVIFIIWHAF